MLFRFSWDYDLSLTVWQRSNINQVKVKGEFIGSWNRKSWGDANYSHGWIPGSCCRHLDIVFGTALLCIGFILRKKWLPSVLNILLHSLQSGWREHIFLDSIRKVPRADSYWLGSHSHLWNNHCNQGEWIPNCQASLDHLPTPGTQKFGAVWSVCTIQTKNGWKVIFPKDVVDRQETTTTTTN